MQLFPPWIKRQFWKTDLDLTRRFISNSPNFTFRYLLFKVFFCNAFFLQCLSYFKVSPSSDSLDCFSNPICHSLWGTVHSFPLLFYSALAPLSPFLILIEMYGKFSYFDIHRCDLLVICLPSNFEMNERENMQCFLFFAYDILL